VTLLAGLDDIIHNRNGVTVANCSGLLIAPIPGVCDRVIEAVTNHPGRQTLIQQLPPNDSLFVVPPLGGVPYEVCRINQAHQNGPW
jgi:hypothetical protein